jgi:thiamine biosynthesis protein ThiS
MSGPQQECFEVLVNGEQSHATTGQTLLDFIKSLGLDETRVAIEMDGVIIKRNGWANALLRPGSRLEIVQFVGGG